MSLARQNRNRDVWLIAWALALALHVAGVFAFRNLKPMKPESTVHRIEPIQLVFQKPPAAAKRSDAPQFFTELPPNRADEAPKKPDFLSNVTSRARQPVPGPDGAMPRMQGEGMDPGVKLTPDGGASRASMPLPTSQQNAPAAPTQSPQPHDASTEPQTGTTSATPSQKPSDARQTAAGAAQTPSSSAGNYDIYQPEMDNPNGSSSLTGDVSLNTTAWNYAPWLERFGRELMHHWFPPPAYSIGILKEGGWSLIEVEISKSGELLRLEVLEQHGHPSLSQAAQSALRYMAPMEKLPADFPEPTLVLRIRMIYPKLHPR